jgi:hypothetical protein
MKKLLWMGALCLLAGHVLAQPKKSEQRFPVEPGTAITLDIKYATRILVQAWDKPEVLLQTEVNINGGRDNDALKVEAGQTREQLSVRAEVENLHELSRQHQYYYRGNPDSVQREDRWLDIHFTVYVPRNAPVQVRTVSGDVDIVHNGGELTATSVGGNVDLTMRDDQKADVRMSTVGGEVFTNFALEAFRKDGAPPPQPGNRCFCGKLGGGGTRVVLTSTGGDIYLRKAGS